MNVLTTPPSTLALPGFGGPQDKGTLTPVIPTTPIQARQSSLGIPPVSHPQLHALPMGCLPYSAIPTASGHLEPGP